MTWAKTRKKCKPKSYEKYLSNGEINEMRMNKYYDQFFDIMKDNYIRNYAKQRIRKRIKLRAQLLKSENFEVIKEDELKARLKIVSRTIN